MYCWDGWEVGRDLLANPFIGRKGLHTAATTNHKAMMVWLAYHPSVCGLLHALILLLMIIPQIVLLLLLPLFL